MSLRKPEDSLKKSIEAVMSKQDAPVYEFDQFRVETAERRLLKNGTPVSLPQKTFDTLLVLVRNSGHLMTKDALMRLVWPGVVVEENNLEQRISVLRKTLGADNTAVSMIETVPREGYRFTASVREVWGQQANSLLVEKRTRYHLVVKEETQREKLESSEHEQSVGVSSAVPLIRGRRLALGVLISAVLLTAAVFVALRFRSSRVAPPTSLANIKSIAVLPFKPLGSKSEDEYLQLGMADALITKLGHIRQIRVRPTSAIQKYASGGQDPAVIGQELNVDAVLDGRVQRSGDRIRVTTQLVSVRDHSSMWTDSFDEQYTNIFAVQDAIAGRVTRELSPVLSKQDQEQLNKRPTSNPEAYEAYLKGRYFWSKRTTEGTRKSVTYFKQAIDKDPNFALAYAGLADAYLIDNAAEAESTLRRVMELDWTLGEAHASLGFNRMFWHWDWDGAEQEFKLAIELSPNYATAHQWFAIYLAARGRLDEAKAEMRRAIELDPLSPNMHADMGQIYYFAREYDAAIDECHKALDFDPNFLLAHRYLFYVYAQKEIYDQAVKEYLKCSKLSDKSPELIASSREAYAALGWRGFWLNQLEHWEWERQKAFVYINLGDKERAFRELDKAYESKDFFLAFLKVEPEYDALRSDPRFTDLLKQIKLSE